MSEWGSSSLAIGSQLSANLLAEGLIDSLYLRLNGNVSKEANSEDCAVTASGLRSVRLSLPGKRPVHPLKKGFLMPQQQLIEPPVRYQTMPRWRRFASLFTFGTIATTASLLVGTSAQAQPPIQDEWQYTLEKPTEDWVRGDFKAENWKTAFGGFGSRGTPGARIGTRWTTPDIWLRKTVQLDAIPANPALYVHHDEDVEIYINGTLVTSKKGYTQKYVVLPLNEQARAPLSVGENLIAVHCHQTGGGQFIDVHLIDGDQVPELPPAKGQEKPFISHLTTVWGEKVTAENAWQEYPRPQLTRDNWTNLNGSWNYAITPATETVVPTNWGGKILVPFALESKLSGVQRLLRTDEALWYQRTFDAKKSAGQRQLLNFEAVDYQCEVIVNGLSVGKHVGGSTPFSFDVSKAIQDGENHLVVRVEDKTMGYQLQGKQRPDPHGIWYTQVSGIWQTVWLEQVPETYIEDLTIQTDAADRTISVRPDIVGSSDGLSVKVKVLDGKHQILEQKRVNSRFGFPTPSSGPHPIRTCITLKSLCSMVKERRSTR